jgi:hypothetical protein
MIKVNKEVALSKAEKNANQMYEMISRNAEEGKDCTELMFDNSIYSETLEFLEKKLEGTSYDWNIVRRAPNQFTGRMNHFSSERIGDNRRRVIQIDS